MSEWQEIKLGELVDIGSSKRVFYEDYVNAGIPFYRSKEVIEKHNGNDISTDLFITKEKFEQIKAKYGAPIAGDLLLTSVGTLGIPYIVEDGEEFYFKDGNLTWFKNYKSNLHNKFLYYWIISPIGKNALDMMSIGSTQAALTIQGLKNLDFHAPPVEEQKAIASVLSSLDDKIDLLHRQNNTLERMAETLFRQWFVEEAQEDWEEGTLDDLISVKGGTTPSTKEPSFWNGNINWTSPRDLSNQQSVFMFDTERKITEKGLAKIGSGLLPVGTLLMSSRAPIGYLAISDIPVAINQGYIAIVCDKLVSNYFMYLWCKVNMEQIKNAGNGSTFEEISKSNFRELSTLKPSKEAITKFDETVAQIFAKIKTNQQQIQTLEKLRDNLLPKLMSGEVRVNLS
ncbi:restriction endonuclease subunit S [Methylophilus aquaticus]|uniref:Restriction endonuclease subunit S n=1 Tax=Methylophilus aquaticus TaxID=1971610 RepID=A0ABT9JTI4_9PROT|nr:restriction endonuclease subunit S [Methylophilus aquaticus]MDP8567829.1 restriction endonuclease subunit S [Methylophilus aquaticus]